jgi:hypothetical protein
MVHRTPPLCHLVVLILILSLIGTLYKIHSLLLEYVILGFKFETTKLLVCLTSAGLAV